MQISVVDYGVGNLHSIRKALENTGGVRVDVITDVNDILNAECIVFPGVGAFDRTMEKLLPVKDEINGMLDSGTPALGICIGSHIMFDGSHEGTSEGLGFMDGEVVRLATKQVPHMGWNAVVSDDDVFNGIDSMYFYFAHSFRGVPDHGDIIRGTTEYEGTIIPTLFRKNNVYGCQFHPEKSSVSGNIFLSNFIKFAEGCI